MIVRFAKKAVSASLCVVLCATQVAFAHQAESNFWAERGRARVNPPKLASSALPAHRSLSSTLLAAQPVTWGHSSASIPKIFLPLDHVVPGRVIDAKPGRPTVLHIQDVHRNAEAQAHISGAVMELVSRSTISALALEGAFGEVEVAPYFSAGSSSARQAAAAGLLAHNEIGGAMHAMLSLDGPLPRVLGVDDATHHRANVAAFRQASAKRADAAGRIESLARAVDVQKPAIYNTALLAFDRVASGYHLGQTNFEEYLRALVSEPDFLPRTHVQVARFWDALSLEKALDFDRVENERAQLLAALSSKLSSSDLRGLTDTALAYRAGRLSHARLCEHISRLCRAHGVALSRFPMAERYVRYVLLADGVDGMALFSETRAIEKSTYARLAQTPAERALVENSRFYALARQLIDFSLTPESWSDYKETPRPAVVENLLLAFETFYVEAQARDAAMAQRLLDIGAGSMAPIVLVTGGFHSRGVQQRLIEKGWGVISMTPILTRVDADKGSAYLNVFLREKTPLERLFPDERLFLSEELDTPPQRIMMAAAIAAANVALRIIPVERAGRLFASILKQFRPNPGATLTMASATRGTVRNAAGSEVDFEARQEEDSALTLRWTRARHAKKEWVQAAAEKAGLSVQRYIEIHIAPTDIVEIALSTIPILFVFLHRGNVLPNGAWDEEVLTRRFDGHLRMMLPFWTLSAMLGTMLYAAHRSGIGEIALIAGLVYVPLAVLALYWSTVAHRSHNERHPEAPLALEENSTLRVAGYDVLVSKTFLDDFKNKPKDMLVGALQSLRNQLEAEQDRLRLPQASGQSPILSQHKMNRYAKGMDEIRYSNKWRLFYALDDEQNQLKLLAFRVAADVKTGSGVSDQDELEKLVGLIDDPNEFQPASEAPTAVVRLLRVWSESASTTTAVPEGGYGDYRDAIAKLAKLLIIENHNALLTIFQFSIFACVQTAQSVQEVETKLGNFLDQRYGQSQFGLREVIQDLVVVQAASAAAKKLPHDLAEGMSLGSDVESRLKTFFEDWFRGWIGSEERLAMLVEKEFLQKAPDFTVLGRLYAQVSPVSDRVKKKVETLFVAWAKLKGPRKADIGDAYARFLRAARQAGLDEKEIFPKTLLYTDKVDPALVSKFISSPAPKEPTAPAVAPWTLTLPNTFPAPMSGTAVGAEEPVAKSFPIPPSIPASALPEAAVPIPAPAEPAAELPKPSAPAASEPIPPQPAPAPKTAASVPPTKLFQLAIGASAPKQELKLVEPRRPAKMQDRPTIVLAAHKEILAAFANLQLPIDDIRVMNWLNGFWEARETLIEQIESLLEQPTVAFRRELDNQSVSEVRRGILMILKRHADQWPPFALEARVRDLNKALAQMLEWTKTDLEKEFKAKEVRAWRAKVTLDIVFQWTSVEAVQASLRGHFPNLSRATAALIFENVQLNSGNLQSMSDELTKAANAWEAKRRGGTSAQAHVALPLALLFFAMEPSASVALVLGLFGLAWQIWRSRHAWKALGVSANEEFWRRQLAGDNPKLELERIGRVIGRRPARLSPKAMASRDVIAPMVTDNLGNLPDALRALGSGQRLFILAHDAAPFRAWLKARGIPEKRVRVISTRAPGTSFTADDLLAAMADVERWGGSRGRLALGYMSGAEIEGLDAIADTSALGFLPVIDLLHELTTIPLAFNDWKNLMILARQRASQA